MTSDISPKQRRDQKWWQGPGSCLPPMQNVDSGQGAQEVHRGWNNTPQTKPDIHVPVIYTRRSEETEKAGESN